jgi:hypothetical protein cdiviTM7_00597
MFFLKGHQNMSKKRGLIVLSTLVVALISAVLLAPQAEAAKSLKLKQKVESTLLYANLMKRGTNDWTCMTDFEGMRYRNTTSTDSNWAPSNGDNEERANTFVGKNTKGGIKSYSGVDPITKQIGGDLSCASLLKAGIDIWEGSSKYADFYRHMGGKFFIDQTKAGWVFRNWERCKKYEWNSWGRFTQNVNDLRSVSKPNYFTSYTVYYSSSNLAPDENPPGGCAPKKGGAAIKERFKDGIKNATGSLPSIASGSAEQWYMYSKTFTSSASGCSASGDKSLKEIPKENPDSSGYYYYKIPFTSTGGKTADMIYKTSKGNEKVWLAATDDTEGGLVEVSCSDIGSWLQNNKSAFDKFAKYASEHKDEQKELSVGDTPEQSADATAQSTEGAGEEKEEKTCTSELTGIGWFICPVIDKLADFADSVWGMLEEYLVTSPLQASNDGPYKSWKVMRDLANVLLALVFILIIISQVSNVGISNYGIKKMLPRFIIAAVAVNISYFVIQVIVDTANILGNTLLAIITEPISTVDIKNVGWGNLLALILGAVTTTGVTLAGGAIAASVFGIGTMFMFVLMAIVPGVIGVVGGLIALVFRSALIPVLAILAPLAFAAWILPNTQGVFDKWKKVFTGMVFLYPLAAIYYGGLKLLSFTILGNPESDTMQRLMALFLMFAGTFVILGMALKSNAIIGNLMGRANGLLNKASAPALNAGNKFAKRRAGMKRREFMAKDFSNSKRLRRAWSGGLQRGFRKINQRSLDRETRAALAEQSEQQRYRSGLAEASGGELDKRLGFAAATTGGQAYIHKLSEEAAATRYKFEFQDDHVRALREGDEHVQALAAEKLSQSAWGAGELRKYLEDGGKITSHKMGDNMAAAKKYDAGVAKVGLAAADAIRGGQKDYGVTENQLAEVTSKAVGGLSTDTLATQNAKALVDAISQGGLSRDKASKVANNARNLSQASADSADIFEAVSKGDSAQLKSVIGKLVGQSNQKSAATPSVPPLQQNQAPQGVAQPTPSQAPSMAPDRQYAIKEQARGAEASKPDSLSSSSGGQTQAPAPQVNVTVQVDRSSDPTSATSIPPSYIDQGGTSGGGRSQHRRNRPPTAFGR